MQKLRVSLIFGGRSAEHEVSIQSAQNVYHALDKQKYIVRLFGITKTGQLLPVSNFPKSLISGNTQILLAGFDSQTSDVVIPIMHGPYGEDGTIQGMLKLLNIPFVGADVLGSAIAMDKDVTKRLLQQAGIPTAQHLTLNTNSSISFKKISNLLGLPLFVKPANLGSSVGVSKVHTQSEFTKAKKLAFKYDTKIIIEENISGREIECSVLGNENPRASLPGEVIVHDDFYSYRAKYIDENGAALKIPADLSSGLIKMIQNLAVKTFKTLNCEGMARVDFFVRGQDVFVNEINTIPGFTNISMYPKLWEASGLPYAQLLDQLIELALERFKKQQILQTDVH